MRSPSALRSSSAIPLQFVVPIVLAVVIFLVESVVLEYVVVEIVFDLLFNQVLDRRQVGYGERCRPIVLLDNRQHFRFVVFSHCLYPRDATLLDRGWKPIVYEALLHP